MASETATIAFRMYLFAAAAAREDGSPGAGGQAAGHILIALGCPVAIPFATGNSLTKCRAWARHAVLTDGVARRGAR